MSEPVEPSPSAQLRQRLLEPMLASAARHGWNARAVRQAAIMADLSEAELTLAAPPGASDPALALVSVLIRDWADLADAHTRDTLRAQDLSVMRVRDRIATGVKLRIEVLAPHKEAARAASLASVAPWRASLMPCLLFRAAHTIWKGIDDSSTDWNWYSKRLILSGVIATTLSVWLESEDEASAWQRLDQAIENVMRFETFKRKARGWREKCPNPMDVLGRRRPAP